MMSTRDILRTARVNLVATSALIIAMTTLFASPAIAQNSDACQTEQQAPDKMPSFKGGDTKSFQIWASKRVKYPSEATKKGIQGTVRLSFIVEKDGSIGNIEVIESPDEALSKEAIRVVEKSSKKWTPAEKDGEKVRCRYRVPIGFFLPY